MTDRDPEAVHRVRDRSAAVRHELGITEDRRRDQAETLRQQALEDLAKIDPAKPLPKLSAEAMAIFRKAHAR